MSQFFIALSSLTAPVDPNNLPSFFTVFCTLSLILYGLCWVEFNEKDKNDTSIVKIIKKLQSGKFLLILWILSLILAGISLWNDFPYRFFGFQFVNSLNSTMEESMNVLWSFFGIQRFLVYFWPGIERKFEFSEQIEFVIYWICWIIFGLKVVGEFFGFLNFELYVAIYIIYLIYLTIICILSISTGLKSRDTFSEYVIWALVRVVILKYIQILVLFIFFYSQLDIFEILIISKKFNVLSSLFLFFADGRVAENPIIVGHAFKTGVFRSTVGVVVGIPGLPYPDLPRAENTPKHYGFVHERARMG